MKSLIFFLFSVLLASGACADMRLWQTLTGKTLEAELVEAKGGYVLLNDKEGKSYRIMITRLDQEGGDFIRAWKQKQVQQVDRKPISRAQRQVRAPGETRYDSLRELEMKAAELINAQREENGLSPLKFDHKAADVARAHSQDMVEQSYFSHTAKDGRSPFDRMRDGGVKFGGAGENIAINSSPSGATTAWMNSPGHRANILKGSFKRTGMGIWKKDGQLFLTQVFMN